MSKAVKVGDIGTEHGGFHETKVISGSPDVFIDGMPVARVGDQLALHDKPKNPPHGRVIVSGSTTVFINGKPMAITGGAISCGGVTIGSGSVTVHEGGGYETTNSINTSKVAEATAEAEKTVATMKQQEAVEQGATSQNVHSSANTSNIKANNYYWPHYDPTTGEDLTDKLKQALEANHQQVLLLTKEDGAQTLVSMWEESGTDSLKAMDKIRVFSDHGYAIYKTYEMVKQFGDLGVVAKVFTSNGNKYISIAAKDNSGKALKHVLVNGTRLKLDGHKYRINNPKVIQLGLTPQSKVAAFKGTALVTFVISAAIATNDLVFNDDYYLVDWFGNVGVDMFKALVAFGVGEVAILIGAAIFGGVPILAGVVVAVIVSLVIDSLFEEWDASEQIIKELRSFEG